MQPLYKNVKAFQGIKKANFYIHPLSRRPKSFTHSIITTFTKTQSQAHSYYLSDIYMADQRRPFRFRLPFLPPAPAPAAEPRPARQPAAAPPRPPFRPAGMAPPAQPSPRAEPTPPTPASAPPRAATQPRGTAGPPLPSRVITPPAPPTKVEQPSTPRTTTEPSTSALKPTLSPKPEPPSHPLAATVPRIPTPEPTPPSKTGSPSTVSTTIEANSPPKPARRSPSPLSPGAASKPPFPSQSATWSKPSTPSSSSPSSPREKAPTKPRYSPKREPSPTPKYPVPPTLVDQSSSSKKEPENLEAQPHATTASGNASDSDRQPQKRTVSREASPNPLPDPIQNSGTSTPDLKEPQEVKRVLAEPTINQNGEPKMKEFTQLPESDFGPKPEAAVHPVAVPQGQSMEEVFHRKEVITTSGAGKKPAVRPHNHKPAGEKAPLQKEIKEDISKFVHKLSVGQGKQPLDGDKQVTVITLAGENKGASMTLSNEARKKESSIRIHRGYRANPDEGVETSADGEESSKGKGKGKLSDLKTDEETATKAYINSNVQGVNNSLLFNGSVSTMNPGVQYVLSRHHPESSKGGHEGGSYETFKAECSATPSEKLAYAPTVRRRCLGGLFMESSDSDADNPEKPRRHGCRYGRKDKNIGVL